MAAHVLVVATVTATSDDLLAALKARAERGPVDFTLVMPASAPGLSGRKELEPQLQAALERWTEAGLTATGSIGNSDPTEAVAEVCSPGRFDEVIVSTLPGQSSRWLRVDVPSRIAAFTDLPVTHVTALSMARKPVKGGPPPEHKKAGIGMLNVMAYGTSRRH
jgi:hypothetical protein